MNTAPINAAQTRSDRRGEVLAVLAILAAAALLRLALAGLDRVIKWDEPDYLTLGINLFAGRGYTTGVVPELHYTPLYPIITGLLYQIVRNAQWASNIVYIVAGTLLILPIYAIARRIYGVRVAIITAVLLVAYPALSASVLYWGTMTEPLFLLLVYCAYYAALVAMEDDRLAAFAAAGALLGLAYLTRPEAIITIVLIAAYLAFLRLLQRRLFTRAALSRLAVLILAFALVSAPYLGFLYAKSGRLLISGKLGLTYAMGQAVLDKDPAEYDRLIASLDSTGKEIVWYSPDRFSYSVLGDLLNDPMAFVRRTWANARILSGLLFNRTIFPTLLGIPVLLGLVSSVWDRRRLRRESFLALLAVIPLASFLPFHIEIRFFAPLLPVLLIWAAGGLVEIGRWLQQTWALLTQQSESRPRLVQTLAVLPVVLVVAFFLLMLPRVVRGGQANLDWTHKEAGLWLRDNAPAGAVIMTRDLAVAVYAQRAWIPSPNADLDSVLAYARHHGATHYVVDESEITTLRPQLLRLLDTSRPPAALMYERTFKDDKRRTIIYRLP
jgi:4-amino-4-deoxy-L-arabinose transferase-like glycosyltransferase